MAPTRLALAQPKFALEPKALVLTEIWPQTDPDLLWDQRPGPDPTLAQTQPELAPDPKGYIAFGPDSNLFLTQRLYIAFAPDPNLAQTQPKLASDPKAIYLALARSKLAPDPKQVRVVSGPNLIRDKML